MRILGGVGAQKPTKLAKLGKRFVKPARNPHGREAAFAPVPGRCCGYRVSMPEMSPQDFENLLKFRTGLRRFLHWSQTQARAVGLTPAQHQLLVAIKGHPGKRDPTISELAEYLLLRHHSVVELVDRAAHAGVVTRRRDAEDGRLTRVALTRDGEARLARLGPTHVDELRNLAPVLDQLVNEWTARSGEETAGPA